MDNQYSINELLARGDFRCKCGKVHRAIVSEVVIKKGAIKEIPDILRKRNVKKAFVLADENTYKAAGVKVAELLNAAEIPYSKYVMGAERIEPTEEAVGSVSMHFDSSCDILVAVGSGVINDISKIIANISHIPLMIVGTAPSMDGYASATSSVIRDHLKISLNSKCPDIVIGDTEVLVNAPKRMIQSGIGDMLAKYVSLVEWQLGSVITGEYYCEEVANIIRNALNKVVSAAKEGLDKEETVQAVMEGMVLSGIAANYAGVSRPVSGIEHYFSHIWDMRSVEFGTPSDFHGIQCGLATVSAIKIYERIRTLTPDREKALAHAAAFDLPAWNKVLSENLGNSALAMFENERKEGKYNVEKHAARLEVIISNWGKIIDIINTLPPASEVESFLRFIGAPASASEIGITPEEEHFAYLASKDIRDKYIASRLLWDMGEI